MYEKSIKAFNQGYNLSKLDPLKARELSGTINTRSPEAMQYFKAGARQYELEKAKDHEVAQNSREKKTNKDKGYGY